jgi:hypothetical protein
MALIAVSALVSSLRFALAQPAPPPDPQQPAYTPSELVPATEAFPSVSRGEQDRAFIKRFLMHYGIYRRYPLGRFPALRNAWRAAQP